MAVVFVLQALITVAVLNPASAFAWYPFIYAFALIPICDQLTANVRPWKISKRFGEFVLYTSSIWHLVIWSIMIFQVGRLETFSSVLVVALNMGLSCGVLGINIGHELGTGDVKVTNFWPNLC